MHFSFNDALEVMKNTTYIEKCIEFDTVILTFTKNVLYLIYIPTRTAFCLKRVVLLGLKSTISVEKGVLFFFFFYIQNSRKGGVFQTQTWARAWHTLWSGVCACVCVCVVTYQQC